jgi:DNA-binding NarL/FixJ family response regulator
LEDLVGTIYSAYKGEAVCSPRIAYTIFARVAELSLRRLDDRILELLSLTPRESEVLGFIADGLSNKEIASQLNLSLYTVKNHVHNLMEKLRVHNRLEVVRHALRNGFIDLARKH